MFKISRMIFAIVILVMILITTACSNENPVESIYYHLENAVTLESEFEQQQEPLSKTELKEYELYEEILGLSDIEEIKKLALEAKELATSRKTMIDQEKASIQEAYEEFRLIHPLVDSIVEEQLKSLAMELIQAMDDRHEAYMQLYNEYHMAINLDLELYQLVQREDLTIEELQSQHDLVNQSYETVNGYKEKFNDYTIKYNELKRQLYEQGELEVVYN